MLKAIHLKLERSDWQMIFILLATFVLIVAAHFFTSQVINDYEDASSTLNSSFNANILLHDFDNHMATLENSVQRLMKTGDEKFSAQAEQSLKSINRDMAAIRGYFAGIAQKDHLDHFEELVNRKLRFHQTVLDNHRAGGHIAAVQIFGPGQDPVLQDSIINLTDSLRLYHQKHFQDYLKQKSKTTSWLRTSSWLRLVLVLFVCAFSTYFFVKNALRRNRLEWERSQHLAFIKDLYDNAPIGFHSTDANHVIIEMNQTELDWLGYKREEVVGKMKLSELSAQDDKSMKNLLKILAETGKLENIEGTLKRKDGSLLSCLYNSRAILDEAGNLLYTRVALMDFTPQKKMQVELEKAKKAAERSGLLKEQFVANMSHEIRTPINAILGFSNLLQRTELDTRQQEFAHNIQTSSENLLSIVNDILDFSKIEAGALRIERIPFSLHSLLHSVDNMLRYRATEKKLAFSLAIGEEVPDALLGDPTRLTQVLVNLLGNAFKFTDQGSVSLKASSRRLDSDKIAIRFVVEDTGIGVPPDKLEAIFERFGQAASDTTRRFGGTGLGLTISKQLIELQGGSIRVESTEGQGATFIVELPYERADEPAQQDSGGFDAPHFNRHSFGILIVEDNPMNQRIAELMLDNWGIAHQHAANGKIALEMLRKNVFDLVLMDIQMPEMDGYSAARTIRQELRLDVPIIATTAHAFAGEREKCISYGMNDYIAKPIREQELLALIMRYAPSGKSANGSSPERLALETIGANGFDRQYVLDISKGNPEVLCEMTSLFVSQSEKELEQIGAALHANIFGDVATAAHSMKSTAAYMGFEATLGGVLKRLEMAAKEKSPDAGTLQRLFEEVKMLRNAAILLLQKEFLSEK